MGTKFECEYHKAPHTLNFIISENSVQLHAPAIYLPQKESLAPT